MEAQMLLRDSEIYPSEEVLKEALGEVIYKILESFLQTISGEAYGLTVEWKYYNDGKAWFGKVVCKKKTILWFSVWEGFFKISFYFTEKHLEAVAALQISETVKDSFAAAKPIGKLIPLTIDISTTGQLEDLLTVVRFKKNLK